MKVVRFIARTLPLAQSRQAVLALQAVGPGRSRRLVRLPVRVRRQGARFVLVLPGPCEKESTDRRTGRAVRAAWGTMVAPGDVVPTPAPPCRCRCLPRAGLILPSSECVRM